MTAFASGFDFLTKRRNKIDNETKLKVIEMAKKVANHSDFHVRSLRL